MRVAMKVPPGLTVLSGMSATVALTYRRASILGEQILVPISAVLKDAQGESVAWVIGKDEVVQRRPVTLGAATGNAIEITDGLQPGDRIAVAGVRFLRDGMTVRDLGDALGAGQS
jgi:multidrug efflux pump subunit AcrA (membrane-fusion protein)